MAKCPPEAFNCTVFTPSYPTLPLVVPGPFNAKSVVLGPTRIAQFPGPAAPKTVTMVLAAQGWAIDVRQISKMPALSARLRT
jgi:hypothetical protein